MRTILLADDDEDVRAVFRMRLERLQHRVLEAANGTLALELTRRERPDLLVLDWTMPGLSGIEILKALRQDPRTANIPVIMLSGKEGGSEHAEAVALGAFAYLVKPVSPPQLLETIQEALRKKG
jgi:CheY-like chemotaxis protein